MNHQWAGPPIAGHQTARPACSSPCGPVKLPCVLFLGVFCLLLFVPLLFLLPSTLSSPWVKCYPFFHTNAAAIKESSLTFHVFGSISPDYFFNVITIPLQPQ